MKKLITIIILSISCVFAEATEYVACRDLKSVEYNAVFEFENNKIVKFSTLESDFKDYVQVPEQHGVLSFIYVAEYDTNFGYDVYLTESTTELISLSAWVSGNDSDNYDGVVNDVKTECHLLKAKPKDSVLRIDNFSRIVNLKL